MKRLLFLWCKLLCCALWLLATIRFKQPEEGLGEPLLVLAMPLTGVFALGTPLAFALEWVRTRVSALDSWAAWLFWSLLILGVVWKPGPTGNMILIGGLGCALTGLELALVRKGRPPSRALFIGASLGFIGGAAEIVHLKGGQQFCFGCWLPHIAVVAVAISLDRWRQRWTDCARRSIR